MRELDPFKLRVIPDSQKTDFTKEKLLDILDFYLQYKPFFEGPPFDDESYPVVEAHYFTILLYEYQIFDLNYFDNLDNMREKYGKDYIEDLAKEKLDFFEIITLLTFIHRADRHAGGWYESCIEDKTYYNLLSRLEEIRDDLLKE